MKKDFKKLQDKELENVSGGRTCHTRKTYRELGITGEEIATDQELWYHPVITTWGNRCKGWEESDRWGGGIEDCFHCMHRCKPSGGWKNICLNRSLERDDYK